MEKEKNFINNPKKTAIIGLVASIIIILENIVIRSPYSILMIILSLLPTIALTIYYSIVCLRLYKDTGNVRVARNILVIIYFITVIADILQFFLSHFASGIYSPGILTIILHCFIAIYLYLILFKGCTKISNKIFAIVIIGYYLYSLITLISYGFFDMLALINYILNIATLLYFYSYYEELKGDKTNMEDKANLETIGIPNNNETIDKDTRAKLYQVYCNEVIRTLKAPSTAVFCKEEELIITKEYGRYLVTGWVDSQNSYGAMIRTYYNKFQIENENGVFIPKSNAGTMASNKLAGTLASYWIYGIIATIITSAIFYFLIQASM